MRLALGALHQLTREEQIIRRKAAAPVIDGHQACQSLFRALQSLREKGTTVQLDRPKLNPPQVWATFAAGRFELSAINDLEIRTLCIAEETAMQPEFIASLSCAPEKLRRSRCLYGLVHNYFLAWRGMLNPSAVEGLLITAFTSYSTKNPVVQKWLAHPDLFSSQAASSLAAEICAGQKSVDDTLRSYYIGPLTKLALSVRAAVADSAGQAFRQSESSHDQDWSLRYLRWVVEDVLSDLTPDSHFAAIISLLILSESARNSQPFMRALRMFIQSHKRLGDPRLRESSPNWRAIAPAAAQRYLSWLARDSIIFFFNTILPDTSENRRRKEFWLGYHDSIKDFQVAVSEDDLWKIRSNHKASDLVAYSQVAHPTTSAFLMQFDGYQGKYLVVEFSETGNAAYIFRLAAFESLDVTLRTPRFDLRRHLKFDKTHRIIHNGNWEIAASYMLSSEFGIRP